MSSIAASSNERAVRVVAGIEQERVAYGRLWWVAPLAALVAAGGNVAVYLVASSGDLITPDVILPSGAPMTALEPAISSVIGVAGATALYAVLGHLVRRPVTIFRIVAAVMLIVSFAMPFSLPNASLAYVLSLEVMHVLAAGVSVWALTTLAGER